jgi:hypothetical protein
MKNQTVTGEYSGNGHEELALDQAANEHAGAVGAIKLFVADPLKEARAILVEALCHNPQHDTDCKAQAFTIKHRCLPGTHPTWKSAPACDCWVSRLASWLKNDNNR